MNDPLTEVMFWAQVIGDAKRTVVCSPDLESRVKGWVDARAMGGIITVQASPFVPDDQLYVIDTPAMDAYLEESFQQSMQDWRRSFQQRRGDLRSDLQALARSSLEASARRSIMRGITEG